MQIPDIINTILGNPIILIAIFWIVGIIIAIVVYRRKKSPTAPKGDKPVKRPKIKVKGRLMKQIQKMAGEAEKGKDLSVPPVRSRQEIITQMFESKLEQIGLEASAASDYVPVSYTPLARFLKERDVPESTVSAIIAGIMEEESEESVQGIIEAASPELGLVGDELQKVKDLAVEEWKNVSTTTERLRGISK